MKLITGILAALALVVAVAVSTTFISYSPVHAFQGAQPPAKPTGLSVSTAQGSLHVSADWDDTPGATQYLVRWRVAGAGNPLNDGVRTGSSATAITVADYGEWVVRVEACNDAGCGEPLAKGFEVEPAPEPTTTPTTEPTSTPEPTPVPAPEATPQPTPEVTPDPSPEPTSTPEPTTDPASELQVSITADATELEVNEQVTLTAVITDAPAGSSPSYQWQLDLGGGNWHSVGTEATFSYLQSNAAPTAFRVTVNYGSEASATSDPTIITWGPSNRAPAVDKQADTPTPEPTSTPEPTQEPTPEPTPEPTSTPEPTAEPAFLSVCDRTPQVRDVLVALVGKACEDITAEDLSKLVNLDLSNTGLSSLSSRDFNGMSDLRGVDVRSNTFTSWSQVCGSGKWGATVENINLNNNKNLGGAGAAIPGNCFVGAPNLKTLHLAATRINSIPANAFGNPAGSPNPGDPSTKLADLEWLDLSRNQITSLPANVFSGLSSLRRLDLGRNAITASGLPASGTTSVFDDLSSLEWLALNNQYAQDPNNDYRLTGNPKLTSIPAGLFNGLSSLEELDLANNGITSSGLPDNLFSPLTSLEGLSLMGNPGAPFTLTNKGVRSEAIVIQVVTPPTGFTVGPVSGGVKLSWDKPSDTTLSHQYRFYDLDWSSWTDISNPGTSGSKLEYTTSSGLASKTSYVFQLRSVKNGAASYHANADCSAMYGTSGNDTLTGSDYPDCINGLTGNDTLKGGDGADKLDGGGGTDTVSYSGSPEGIIVNLSTNTATFADDAVSTNSHANGDEISNFENIIGSDNDDILTGDSSANVLTGGNGDDILEGGAGGDTLWGEGGNDTLSYASSDAGVKVNLDNHRTASGGHAQGDRWGGIENLIGSAHDDTLTGQGKDNIIEGGDGDDKLGGNPGNDTLKGGAGKDTLTGGNGDDILEGGAGGDTLWGEDGIDTLSYASSGAGVTVNLANRTASGGHAEGDTFGDFENLTGSAHGDTLTGDGNDNVIRGGTGNDTLKGGAGLDQIFGGAGNDTLHGGAGGDMFHFAANFGNDTITDFTLGAFPWAWDGDSIVLCIPNNANVSVADSGSNHVITLTGGTRGTITLKGITTGSANYDNLRIINSCPLFGTAGDDDPLYGTAGSDLVFPYTGLDVINGLDGNDTLSYATSHIGMSVSFLNGLAGEGRGESGEFILHSGFENIIGSRFNDFLDGGEEANVLVGGPGHDQLQGFGGDDALYGGSGPDQLIGGAGADNIHGGPDSDPDDTYEIYGVRFPHGDGAYYLRSDAGVNVNLSDGTASGGHAEGDTLINIQSLYGSAHADTLTGNDRDNVFDGRGGGDTFDGKDGFDTALYGNSLQAITFDLATPANNTGWASGDTFTSIEAFFFSALGDNITGDATDNIFHGWWGNDFIVGGAGDDIIDGHWGIDTIHGQLGNDSIYGGRGNDKLFGNLGDDIMDGGDGADQLKGDAGDDTLLGGPGDDTLTGGAGDDILEGGAGSDTLWGEGGNDTLSYASSGAGVTVNLANRTVSGGHAHGDTGLGGFENLIGSAHADLLTGDGNANAIWGGNGHDTLRGEGGDDKIAPGAGANTVSGGSGTDEFYFDTEAGYSTINDYATGEKIWLCAGTGLGQGNGKVSLRERASGGDWYIEPLITIAFTNGYSVESLGIIILTGVTTSPGSDIAWSDPNAAAGTGCNYIPETPPRPREMGIVSID